MGAVTEKSREAIATGLSLGPKNLASWREGVVHRSALLRDCGRLTERALRQSLRRLREAL